MSEPKPTEAEKQGSSCAPAACSASSKDPMRKKGVLIPADNSFEAINRFVNHVPSPEYEELQWALLAIASEREKELIAKPTPMKFKIKPPSAAHFYAIGHDIVGNTFVAIKTPHHVDYIYGMFKGRELRGGHLDSIESWHKEGEQVAFTDHPTKGNLVLVMGKPRIGDVTEIVGPEADAIIELEKAKTPNEQAQ